MIKRTVKTTFKIGIFLIVLFLMFVFFWQIFNVSDRLRVSLIKEVEKRYAENIDIERLDVGLTSIKIDNILVVSTDNLVISAERIKFSLSYFNLIKYGFDPKMIFKRVDVIKPIIKIFPSKKIKKSQHSEEKSSFAGMLEEFNNVKKTIDFIKNISIRGGDVFIYENQEIAKGIIYDMNGSLEFKNPEFTFLEMDARFLYPTNEKVSITGEINRKSFIIRSNVENFHLTFLNPVFENSPIRILDGILKGSVNIDYDAKNELSLEGTLDASDLKYNIKGSDIKFVCSDINCSVDKNEINVTQFKIKYLDSEFSAGGRLINILDPRFDLSVSGNDNISDILKLLKIQSPDISSNLNFAAHVQDNIKNPSVVIDINTDSLIFENFAFSDISGTGKIESNIIKIEKINGKINENVLSASGEIGMAELDTFDIRANLRGKIIDVIGADKFIKTGSESELDFNLFKENNQINGAGGFEISILNEDNVRKFSGSINYENDNISVSGAAEDSAFYAEFVYDIEQKKINGKFNNSLNFLSNVLNSSFLKNISKDVQSQTIFEKNGNNISIDGIAGKNNTKIFSIIAEINQIDSSSFESSGEFTLFRDSLTFPSNFEITSINNEYIVNKFNVGNLISLSGNYSAINGDMDFSGRLDTKIKYIKAFLNDNLPWIDQGKLSGDFQLDGTLKSPSLQSKVKLEDIIFQGDYIYDGDVDVNMEESFVLNFKNAVIRNNNRDFGNISGFIDFKNETAGFEIDSRNIQAEQFFKTFISDDPFINGTLDMDVRYNYDRGKETFFTGELKLKKGEAFKIPYDSMEITLSGPDEITEDRERFFGDEDFTGGLFPKRIIFKKLKALTKNRFIIGGNGYFPLSDDKDMDFKLNIEGNLLSMLSEYVEIIKNPQSSGTATIYFVGNYSNIYIGSGDIDVKNGKLEMTTVFDKINDLSFNVTLDEETRYLEIRKFTCTIDGKTVIVKNVPEAAVTENGEKKQLTPYVSSFSGINFGIFYIDAANGITMNLPSYMVEKKKGIFYPEGLFPDEKFYISGPEDIPEIRGRVKLKGVEVQVPFEDEDTSEEDGGVVVNFLKKAYWNLHVISQADNEYYQEMPITLQEIASNPIVRIRIDDGSEGLRFRGVLNEKEFYIEGSITSSKGTIEYLNDIFRVEEAEIIYNEGIEYPQINITAKTIRKDTTDAGRGNLAASGLPMTGLPVNIFLGVTSEITTNPITGQEEWNPKIRLWSDNPDFGENPQRILALFGYEPGNIISKTTEMLGDRTSKIFLSPILNPVENWLQKILSLDRVWFRPRIAGNLFGRMYSRLTDPTGINNSDTNLLDPKFLLRSSEVRLEKYFTDDFYVSYTTALTSTISNQDRETLGLSHLLGLEYRISGSLLFETQLDYNYERYLAKSDKKIFLRYIFPLTDK